jgi:hypothetical protein
MANKTKAKGVILEYGDSAPTSTVIPQKATISMDLGQWDRADKTSHDTSGKTKEYDTTLKEPPSIDVEIFLDPADTAHAWLLAAHTSGDLKYFTMILPDAGNADFAIAGHVLNLTINPALDGHIRANFQVGGSGAYTFTA